MDYLIQFLSRILLWFVDFAEWVGKWIWQEVIGALATLLTAIPVPSWLSGMPDLIGSTPSGVAWLLGAFELPSGLAIIVSAYTLRFLLRRLPIIG
jgi:hypothetical protein